MIRELADIIHGQVCHHAAQQNEWTCPDYKHGDIHFEHFMSQAGELMDRLEPEIGSGNVIPCVRIFMEVMIG
jgi:hypothetical protein